MPNNNVLTNAERNAIERAISEVELCCQFSLANELRALLAAHPGQPEPASRGVIAAALAVIEADRSQTLTNEHVDALENAIKIQRGELTLPEPRAEVADDTPSITNPLTPYGMLVRALRIVTGTLLGDMAKSLQMSSAKLSAMEFGREPVTPEIVREVGKYFERLGVGNMRPALQHAANAARAGDTQ